MRLTFLAFVIVTSTACGDSGTDSAGGGDSDGPAAGGNEGASGPGGGGVGGNGAGGDGTGGQAPVVPFCATTCTTATECATPSAATDEDNWSCEDERCVYLGCLSNMECQEIGPDYACATLPGALIPVCVPTCGTVDDCAGTGALVDADNWSCDASLCQYLGCQSSAECQQVFANPSYECTVLAGATTPTCNLTCGAVSDCTSASPITDADNWTCEERACLYLGCQSTEECEEALMKPNVACE